MTLVKNHRRRLSGNKAGRFIKSCILFLLAGMVVMNAQSCAFIEDLFGKKEVKTRPVEKEKEGEAEIGEVEWEDVTQEKDVIREYPQKADEEKEFFDVLCFLPFNGEHRQKGRDLYSGLKMAANEYRSDMKIRFTTFDVNNVRKEAETVRKLLSSPEFDMIIAPYATADVNQVIELAKGSGAVILSPWNTSSSVDRFAGYIQLNPGIESHFKHIADFSRREFGAARSMIIGARKDAQYVEMLQEFAPGLNAYYTSSNPMGHVEEIRNLIASKNIQSVIIPSWRSADESYFLSLLSAINSARESRKINVFMLASWMNNDKIQYEQFRGMNLHFTSSRFVDYQRKPIQRFDDAYYRQYAYFASEDVFYGHDIFLLASGIFQEFGYESAHQIINFDCRDCLFRYDFVNQVDREGHSFIQNDQVDIISWDNYEYQRVN